VLKNPVQVALKWKKARPMRLQPKNLPEAVAETDLAGAVAPIKEF
jgi:hypothetical protein